MHRRFLLACAALVCLPARADTFYPPVPQGAFQTYTPAVGSDSGTLTAASATGRYQVTGKRVDWSATVGITTNGTAAGFITVSLPPGLPVSSSADGIGLGRENAVNGKMAQVRFVSGTGTARVVNYDNSYPGVNGASLLLSGSYETQ